MSAMILQNSSRKTGQRATVVAIAALALCGFPRRSAAAPRDATTGDAPAIEQTRVARAEAAFDKGRALLQQGRVAEACLELEESQRLDPGLGTQLNLADCYERS